MICFVHVAVRGCDAHDMMSAFNKVPGHLDTLIWRSIFSLRCPAAVVAYHEQDGIGYYTLGSLAWRLPGHLRCRPNMTLIL